MTTANPPTRRSSPLAMIVIGAFIVGMDVYAYFSERRNQADDIEAVRRLQVDIDTTRVLLAKQTTAADSNALLTRIKGREDGLGFIAFHVPVRAETIQGWWTTFSPGTLMGAAGLILLGCGVVMWKLRPAA